MKKLMLLVASFAALASCSTDTTQDVAPSVVPGAIAVSFDDETRVQLDNELKTVWTAGDKVSVFYKSDANECWTFQGDTGDRNGNLRREEQGSATAATDKVVIVYPYSENYELDAQTGSVSLLVPSVQHYTADSYGVGSNIMVSSGTSDSFKLKSVCGWLKLSITGSKTVSKIVLKGNNGEQLAGKAKIDCENLALSLIGDKPVLDDTQVGGTLTFNDEYATALTLDCGSGVILSGIPKAFYISLAPQTLETGITVKIHYTDGTVYEKSTANSIAIERNHIVPMTEIDADAISESEEDYASIRYVTSDKNIIDNSAKNSEWWSKVVSNTYDAENNVGTLVIPKVMSIGTHAFYLVDELVSIEIPDGITSIGSSAFRDCSNLTSITIPDSVKSIGGHAFGICSSLKSIAIPSSVTSVGDYAFSGCSLQDVYITDIAKWCAIDFGDHTSNPINPAHNLYLNGKLVTDLVIPEGVASIGDYAFYNYSKLTSVTIPDSATSIGESAFGICSSLTSAAIGNGVTAIGSSAFSGCNSLTSVTIPDSATSIGDSAFNDCSSLTSAAIGNGVTSIGYYAFDGCSSLTSVTIPDSVTSIGGSAFSGCSSLMSITIGNSVASISPYAFSGCNNLQSVYITDIAKWCAIDFGGYDANPLYYAHNLYLNGVPVTDLVIPDGVTSIEDYAFLNCSSLTSVTIPDSVTSIGEDAFSGCSSLTDINIPQYVTSIGDYAFAYCSSLTSIDIPDGVTTISNHVFCGCSSLKSVNIPNSITWIGASSFSGCHSLTDIVIPGSVQKIASHAFAECRSITSINIPAVGTIQDCAFEGCINLSSVHITDIAKWCRIRFSDATAQPLYYAHDLYLNGELVTDLVIPDGVESINNRVFAGSLSLTKITIPDSVTSIGYYAFYRCGNLASVTIGKGIRTIDDRAFYNCANLTSIYCKSETPPTLKIVDNFDPFFGISDSVKIYVPAASVDAYKTANVWSEYADKIVGYDF